MLFCLVENSLYDYANKNLLYFKDSIQLIMSDHFDDFINQIEQSDEILIVIGNNHILEHCINVLHEKKIFDLYIVDLYAIDRFCPIITENGEFSKYVKNVSLNKPYLVHMETHINNSCNLNCKACNNFSPWIVEDNPVPVESLINDLTTLSSFVSIGRLCLLGGEPLLEEELVCSSLQAARKILVTSEIRLLTNGLLIPNMKPAFWDCIRENEIIIYITLYPPTLKKLKEIKDTLQHNHIRYVFGPQVITFEKRWTDKPYEDSEYNSNVCASSGCHYFGNGIYTKCPDAATIIYAGDIGSIAEKSKHKIDDIKDGWQLCNDLEHSSDMCRYCSIERREEIQWQSTGKTPDISDWMLESRDRYLERMKSVFKSFIKEKTQKEAENVDIAIWGCGKGFNDSYRIIKDFIPIKYLTDKNEKLLSLTCERLGVKSLSIKDITRKNEIFYLITVDNTIALTEICAILDKKRIRHAHIRELLSYKI